jgi:phage/plasmid primase-like uncharacterized protein
MANHPNRNRLPTRIDENGREVVDEEKVAAWRAQRATEKAEREAQAKALAENVLAKVRQGQSKSIYPNPSGS